MNLIYKYLYNQQNKRIIITDLRWDYDLNYGEIDADYFFNNIQQHICIYCALKNPPPQPGTVLYMPKSSLNIIHQIYLNIYMILII